MSGFFKRARRFFSSELGQRVTFTLLALGGIGVLGKLSSIPGLEPGIQPVFREPCSYTWYGWHTQPCGPTHFYNWFEFAPFPTTYWWDPVAGIFLVGFAGLLAVVLVRRWFIR